MSQLAKQITPYSESSDVHLQRSQRDIEYVRFLGQITKGFSLIFALVFGAVALLQMVHPVSSLIGIDGEVLAYAAVGLSAFFLGVYLALSLSTGMSVSIQRIRPAVHAGGCSGS
ncbi:MAG: hypothetical protein IBX50_14700 [Marinospirillum sp.]|uniref:hypothetical protein n=1 Tax=Marinospirillum sp. TaxID=2183934 RepID=UPI0019EDE0E0|nr:hypothetical protein [Marinospirillum sp.]MBE0507938.1 hypothetical protein [Marinospirillum sp.]